MSEKQQIIKIKLKSYDNKIMEKSIKEIIDTMKKTNAKIIGPIPMPTYIERFTILTSPHVDKKARDQYEIRTYKRLIVIENSTEKTVDFLMKLNLSFGVDIKISVI